MTISALRGINTLPGSPWEDLVIQHWGVTDVLGMVDKLGIADIQAPTQPLNSGPHKSRLIRRPWFSTCLFRSHDRIGALGCGGDS